MKKVFIALAALFSLIFCSCSYDVPVISDPSNDIRFGIGVTAPYENAVDDDSFQGLYSAFRVANEAYFEKADSALNSIINQKYSYIKTAYNHSDGIYDTLGMFFSESSAASLDLYFMLLGYSDREYNENGCNANFICKKDSNEFRYEASYNTETHYMSIIQYVDGVTCEEFKCTLTNGTVTKIYYNASVGRTFFSKADVSGSVYVMWYDGEIMTENNNETGRIDYDGTSFSGILN